jgi:O-methyltransferase/methyltransferase family protein
MSPDYILETAFAFRNSKALLTAVELGLFEALAKGPQNAEALTRQLGLNGRGARDFFDALVALKLLDRDADGLYANAPDCSVYLDPDRPAYIGDLLEYLNARMYRTWDLLTPALREGAPQCGPAAAGGFMGFYKDQAAFDIFLKGMTGGSRMAAQALARIFPWESYNTVIDIGTAQGCVPVEIAKAHPHLTGGGFDLPQLRAAFASYLRAHGLDKRLTFFPGNFFDDPLPSADVLIMGRVLHDWSLPQRKLLLNKAYQALPKNGVLIVHEAFIDDSRRTLAHGLLASLNMLIQTDGGSEFTALECKTWMREAGFGATNVIALTGAQAAVIGIRGAEADGGA